MASSPKPTSEKVNKVKNSTPSTTITKLNGKQFVRQRPHLLPSTLNNNNDDDVLISDDEDDRIVGSVAAKSRITYAIAMNNRMVQEGAGSSGSNSGGCSASSGTYSASEPSEEATVGRYPRRVRREVNYNEQLNPTDDDHYICKFVLFTSLDNNNNSDDNDNGNNNDNVNDNNNDNDNDHKATGSPVIM